MFLMTDQMESDSKELCIATGTPLHMVKYDRSVSRKCTNGF